VSSHRGVRMNVPTDASRRDVRGTFNQRFIQHSSIRAHAIADSTATGGVGVGRSEHSQQGRTTAGPRRLATTSHASDSTGPLESSMHRCGFLGLRFIHRQEPPKQKRDPHPGPRSTNPLGRREPQSPTATPSWPRSTSTPAASACGRGWVNFLSLRFMIGIAAGCTTNRVATSGKVMNSIGRKRVPISSDRTDLAVDPDRNRVTARDGIGEGQPKKPPGRQFPLLYHLSSRQNCSRRQDRRLAKKRRRPLDLLSAWSLTLTNAAVNMKRAHSLQPLLSLGGRSHIQTRPRILGSIAWTSKKMRRGTVRFLAQRITGNDRSAGPAPPRAAARY
jgi:hypothetical protein